jgi:hypothetical protein
MFTGIFLPIKSGTLSFFATLGFNGYISLNFQKAPADTVHCLPMAMPLLFKDCKWDFRLHDNWCLPPCFATNCVGLGGCIFVLSKMNTPNFLMFLTGEKVVEPPGLVDAGYKATASTHRSMLTNCCIHICVS